MHLTGLEPANRLLERQAARPLRIQVLNDDACDRNRTCIPWMATRHLHHWTTHAYYQNKGTAGNRTRLMSFADSMTPRVTVPIEPLRRVELRSPGYEQGIVSTTTSRAYSIVGMTGVEPALSGVQGRRLTIKPSSRLYRKNESACDRNRTCIPWMATRHLHHWTTHAIDD